MMHACAEQKQLIFELPHHERLDDEEKRRAVRVSVHIGKQRQDNPPRPHSKARDGSE
jgi:hypothetical protein